MRVCVCVCVFVREKALITSGGTIGGRRAANGSAGPAGSTEATKVREAVNRIYQPPAAHVRLFSLWRTLYVRVLTDVNVGSDLRILTDSVLYKENKRVWARSFVCGTQRTSVGPGIIGTVEEE